MPWTIHGWLEINLRQVWHLFSVIATNSCVSLHTTSTFRTFDTSSKTQNLNQTALTLSEPNSSPNPFMEIKMSALSSIVSTCQGLRGRLECCHFSLPWLLTFGGRHSAGFHSCSTHTRLNEPRQNNAKQYFSSAITIPRGKSIIQERVYSRDINF